MRNRLFIILIILFSSNSWAQYFQMDLMKKRQQNKESTRWTLVDWLSQKQRISLWDQWLAANRSANWFELQLAASQLHYEKTTTLSGVKTLVDESSNLYVAEIWLTLVGLRAEWEKTDADTEYKTAALSVRLIGSSLQSTHFLVRGGIVSHEALPTGEKWESHFAAAKLKMYFLDFIGLESEYRRLFASSSQWNKEKSGYSVRSGLFIEWGALNVNGHYWREPIEYISGGSTSRIERDGFDLGVALNF